MTAAGASVAPHLRCLRAVGFCRLPAGAAPGAAPGPARRALHRVYHVFALAATSTYVVQQLVYAYQERRDMEKLSRVLFVVLCHATCVAKQFTFHVDAARIERLVLALDEPQFNQRSAGAAALQRAAARRAARLVRVYAGCAVATCALWAALLAAERARGRTSSFPFWLPFRCDHPLAFASVLAYSFYVTNLVAVGNTTMDAFVATVLDQCKTQIQILRINFENLTETAKIAAENTGRNHEDVLYDSFVDCIIHYRKISESCELVQSVFGWALLVQFGAGGWILCMAAYNIVSVELVSAEFASTTLFIVCILTELLLYCYYGNELTVQSQLVAQSMYCTQWRRAPLRFRRALLVAAERARRPLRPAAGRVIPLSLDTYVKILKSSYSFYAVLRQTK